VSSGKSVSCVPQNIIRYQSPGMALGQAAGIAAALAAATGTSPRHVDVHEVQRILLRQGAYLGKDERLHQLSLL
jgi:hypothetical protein